MIKVVDVMTADPITLQPTDTILQAEDIMDQQRIRQLPVVEDAELVGIITDRDVRQFLGGRLFGEPHERERAMNTQIATVMTRTPVSLNPDDELRDVIDLLIEEKVGGIPVVDDKEGLVGIVTYVDILGCFLDRLQED